MMRARKYEALSSRLDALFVACANAVGKELYEDCGKNLPAAIARLRSMAMGVDSVLSDPVSIEVDLIRSGSPCP
jgi:hypothetical protein